MHRSLAVFVVLAIVAKAVSNYPYCRCTPDQSCWPSESEWQALNSSVRGHLVAVTPVAAACHDPSYDSVICQNATSVSTSSLWRRQQPGAVQWPNWEAWPLLNQSCYFDGPREAPCGQGRVPEYSVAVESAQDVQVTVRFAQMHNLRLAIKNTGHCYLGRSTAPNSLQLATHKLRDITFADNFIPEGSEQGHGAGPAVTIGAGVILSDLYSALATEKRTAVLGFSRTVGAAGGYVQGGGHSPLGPWKGMASDNALEFQLVTATGDLVVANEYQNPDLFWALRGGGGGTFGVVTSVTLRTFEDPPVALFELNVTVAQNQRTGSSNYWPAIAEFHSYIPRLNDESCSGYYFMSPNLTVPDIGMVSSVSALLLLPDQEDDAFVNELLQPLLTALRNMTGVTVSSNSSITPRMSTLFESLLVGDTDVSGRSVLASRLISRDFLLSSNGPTRLAEALSQLRADDGDTFLGHIVAGGTVASNREKIDSAVNPAWRDTATHIDWARSWGPTATLAEIQAVQHRITDSEVPLLKALEPGRMGAYVNEADPNEPNFQESFWGSNYPQLYAIKQEWDPTGLFITRKGVGSEDWDDAGLCAKV